MTRMKGDKNIKVV